MDTALIKDVLTGLLDRLDLPYGEIAIAADGSEGFIRVDIASPQASRIIGWRGETLNAIQALVKAIMRSKQKLEKAPFIVIDVDGYRRMQEDKVRVMVERKADFVRRTKSRVALPPMSPYFRRIVHTHVASHAALQDLITESTGEGDYRQVVVRLKDESGNEGQELSPVMEAPTQEEKDTWANLDV